MSKARDIECWLTDMDGVLVHESKPIPGAAELLAQWRDAGTPFLVLTNNPFYTPRDLSARLRISGLEVPEERIWTSALSTAEFLRSQHPGGTAFVIVTHDETLARMTDRTLFMKDGSIVSPASVEE